MVGPKPAVKAKDIIQELIGHDIYNDSKSKLKSKKDPIWKEICKALEVHGEIKPTNLYIQAYQDRNEILTSYCKAKNLPLPKPESVDCGKSDNEEEDSLENQQSKKRKKGKLTFDFVLSAEQWRQLNLLKNYTNVAEKVNPCKLGGQTF